MLIMLLQRTRNYSVPQLAEELGVDRRSVYRYIDTLNEVGFIVRTDHRRVRLENTTLFNRQLADLLYFNHEEASILYHAIDSIVANNAMRNDLKHKLSALYGIRESAEKHQRAEHVKVREQIAEAIERRMRVVFVGYSSPNSDTKKDRLVEAFQFSEDGNYIWAYELESAQNKVFRVSRIQQVRVLDECWLESRHHQAGYTDAFQMISFDGKTIPVRMRMARRAYNLLVEEFPATEQDIIYDAKANEWIYDSRVSNMHGIGRFVLGLCDSITIETPELRCFVRYMAQRYILPPTEGVE